MTIRDYKEEIKKNLLHPEKADFNEMVYYAKGRVKLRENNKKGARKIGQKYIEYLHFINRGICSATYMAMIKGFPPGDSSFRLAQQRYNKPLAIMRKYNIIEGLTGKEHLKSHRNMTFYFFTPNGKTLYKALIEKGFQLPSDVMKWLDDWLDRVGQNPSERYLEFYFNQMGDYYKKVGLPFYRYDKYMHTISTINTKNKWPTIIMRRSRKEWLSNYLRALNNRDKTWLKVNLDKIIPFTNVLINEGEYTFLGDVLVPFVNDIIKQYWNDDGIPVEWINIFLEWFNNFIKLELEGKCSNIWAKMIREKISNDEDKAHILHSLFEKINKKIFDTKGEACLWSIIDFEGYRLIDPKKKTPSI